MKTCLCLATGGVLSCAAAAPAAASIILALVGNPVAVAGGADYTYTATLSVDEQLDPKVNPVFFTLYDFGAAKFVGATGDLATQGAWNFALNANRTDSAQAIAPNNNPGIFDVRATYMGPDLTGRSLRSTPGNLGTFTLFTTSIGPYSIVANNQDAQLETYFPGNPTNDTVASNIASVAVPTPGRAVPEPASLAILGVGLFGLAVARRRRAEQTEKSRF